MSTFQPQNAGISRNRTIFLADTKHVPADRRLRQATIGKDRTAKMRVIASELLGFDLERQAEKKMGTENKD